MTTVMIYTQEIHASLCVFFSFLFLGLVIGGTTVWWIPLLCLVCTGISYVIFLRPVSLPKGYLKMPWLEETPVATDTHDGHQVSIEMQPIETI